MSKQLPQLTQLSAALTALSVAAVPLGRLLLSIALAVLALLLGLTALATAAPGRRRWAVVASLASALVIAGWCFVIVWTWSTPHGALF